MSSHYVREHVYFSVQYERAVIEERQHVGVDRIMFATDFPYIENEFPNTRPIIDKIYASAGSGPIIASNSSAARPPDPLRDREGEMRNLCGDNLRSHRHGIDGKPAGGSSRSRWGRVHCGLLRGGDLRVAK